jgi:hypothetical protein
MTVREYAGITCYNGGSLLMKKENAGRAVGNGT